MAAPKKPDLDLFGALRSPVIPYRAGAARPTMTPTRIRMQSTDKTGRAGIPAALINNTYSITDNITTPYSVSTLIQIDALPGSPLTFFTNTNSGSPALTYSLVLNTDGTISFSVTDSGGTSTIKSNVALNTGVGYELGFTYAFPIGLGAGPGTKLPNMQLYLNGRSTPTTAITIDTTSTGTISAPLTSTLTFTATNLRLASWRSWYLYVWHSSSVWWVWWVHWWWWWYFWWWWFYWWWWWWRRFSAAIGDPHLVGFRGQKFFFNGEIDKYFNLLSDKDIQVNAYFRHWHTSGEDGLTAIDSIGIMTGGYKIQINANGIATINEEELKENIVGETEVKIIDSLPKNLSSLTKNMEGFAEFVKGYIIENKSYFILIAECTDRTNPNFLNFVAEIKNEKLDPHGIVGQTNTVRDNLSEDELQGKGVIQGSYKDYEVSSLWGTDFIYNRFE